MLSSTRKTMAMAALILHLCIYKEVDSSHDHSDKIISLPGQPPVGFHQFSGYLHVDDQKHRALFYYFVEAEIDPASKPLVLWLNGGSVHSYILPLIRENGPFRPNGEVLVKNEHSWNRVGNMLYLETPAGVGFSYANDSASHETMDDEATAKDNLIFLRRWFDQFPHYKHRDLFLTGESYAGHYIPQLARLMTELDKKEKLFNLKGIALGNPVLEYATDLNSRAEFFWSHGLISDSTYTFFTATCNYSRYVSEYYRDSVSEVCLRVRTQVNKETSNFVDKYDVTLDVCIPSVLSQSKYLRPHPQDRCCIEDETVKYLNREDVKKALHARLVGVHKWTVCSEVLDYELLNLEIPTISIVGLATELGLKTSVPYGAWFQGKQVAGWSQIYGNILFFATIRGASHEAPFSQPQQSLILFKSFLDNRPPPQVL
ncbi:serine carboxypeptidase [Cucumis melo var. makuwa]|uniref:Carboxypeptidase n=1 Tax=Cucumis melo var. makuwa TaxID=1194695 RepID=A0A5D3BF45_CUCMM|nr:serine carboxypeptidase [Cucumis melo var. makuwa]